LIAFYKKHGQGVFLTYTDMAHRIDWQLSMSMLPFGNLAWLAARGRLTQWQMAAFMCRNSMTAFRRWIWRTGGRKATRSGSRQFEKPTFNEELRDWSDSDRPAW